MLPHPIQYQGSKRGLAPVILRYLPTQMERLVEPFAGSAAVSIACAARGRAKSYWLNDLNKPLAELTGLIINHPNELARFYKELWQQQHPDSLEHYYRVREDFNRTRDPRLLLYLLARCVKGAVRYNADGLFNQSPDKRRHGTQPETMRANILGVSALLRGRTVVSSLDYRDVLANVAPDDVVYMDPPYQGVCGERDSRYYAGVMFDEFVNELAKLNRRGVRYAVSYDGQTGTKRFGKPMPKSLELVLVRLEDGPSTQATLLGRKAITVESLYLSAPLAEEVGASERTRHSENARIKCEFPIALFDPKDTLHRQMAELSRQGREELLPVVPKMTAPVVTARAEARRLVAGKLDQINELVKRLLAPAKFTPSEKRTLPTEHPELLK